MLKLYSNIKRLRKMKNMSQQELAESVGYSGKSMIAHIENGTVDLSASMISKFAEVLGVSELELMGLEHPTAVTNPSIGYLIKSSDSELSEKAAELWKQYEGLSPEKQAAFENYLKFLQSNS